MSIKELSLFTLPVLFSRCRIAIFTASIMLLPNNVAAQNYDSYAIFTLNTTFSKLSKNKAKMLFRGKVKSLQGQHVELSDWSQDAPIRHHFYQQLLGKDIAQMNAYWAGLSFSGKARPPKKINEDNMNALIKWLEAQNNRIGYAPLKDLPKNANVLYVVEKEKS